MPHECDECGESFETLSRLRLHDCEDGTDSFAPGSEGDVGAETSTAGEPAAPVGELDELLDQIDRGDRTAVYGAVATFESALSTALADADDGGDTYRDVFWGYYEPVAGALDRAARSEGWALLADVVEAYDPAADDALPLATPAIANAVGRHVIRTRLSDGVAAIPVGALEYLDAVAVHAGDADDIAREETHAYGWGIGHPDHAVVDRLRERAVGDVFSVNPALEHAFYADQFAAIDALERLVRDETLDSEVSPSPRGDLSPGRYLLDCVYGLKMDDYRPTTPRYWDWREEFEVEFSLDEAVERRIRELVADAGIDDDLPADWTLRDLGI